MRTYTKIEEDFIDYIIRNNLKPGDRLPSERDLAASLKVSRPSLREAIQGLKNDDIIRAEVGRGMYLAKDVSEEHFSFDMWKVNYLELLDIKKVLDLYMLEELCRRGLTVESVKEMEIHLTRMENALRENRYEQKEDYLFHRALEKNCTNHALTELIRSITDQLDSYTNRLEGSQEFWPHTVPYHRKMMNGVIQKKYRIAKTAYMEIYRLDRLALESSEKTSVSNENALEGADGEDESVSEKN